MFLGTSGNLRSMKQISNQRVLGLGEAARGSVPSDPRRRPNDREEHDPLLRRFEQRRNATFGASVRSHQIRFKRLMVRHSPRDTSKPHVKPSSKMWRGVAPHLIGLQSITRIGHGAWGTRHLAGLQARPTASCEATFLYFSVSTQVRDTRNYAPALTGHMGDT